MKTKLFLLTCLSLGLVQTSAHAAFIDLGVEGNVGFNSGAGNSGINTISPGAGAYLLLDTLPVFKLGGIYEYDSLTGKNGNGNGHRQFIAGMLRFNMLPLITFDGMVGVTNEYNSDNAFGFGVKLSYMNRIGVMTSLNPYIEYRYLPVKFGSVSSDGSCINAGFILNFNL